MDGMALDQSTDQVAPTLDPLKIYYIVLLGTDDPKDVTLFQGFSTSWSSVSWAMRRIVNLPADVLEPSYSAGDVIAQRMGGIRPLAWAPLSITSLESISAEQFGVFVVLFSGEKSTAERAAAWMAKQEHCVLHVSPYEVPGVTHPDQLTQDKLKEYCTETFKNCAKSFSKERYEAAETAFKSWTEQKLTPSDIKEHGHNVTRPNHMSLERAWRSIEEGKPFIGDTEDEYTQIILESVKAVIKVREDTGLHGFHFMTLIRPELILAEPALYRINYTPVHDKERLKDKGAIKALRLVQKQKGLCTPITAEAMKELQESAGARAIIGMRASELDTFTLGVGVRAAQSVSAVLRLSPGVNHVFPALSAYARNVRSSKIEARLKTPRLFGAIQVQLLETLGPERVAFIQERGGPLKIVSDAPIELLPVGNLPLAMRYECSRLNATPGNLLMGLLLERPPIVIEPEVLTKILVVSAFADDDVLSDILTGALKISEKNWKEIAEVQYRRARNTDEFIAVLNEFEGSILVFDGHGVDNASEPIGKLCIGNEFVDVWSLRGKVRIPPIVILSACDTHGIDASSHATVGNGFLALGAQTVLATLLPVGGVASAAFIARLVHRIGEFIPAAIKARGRALNWLEVMSGMLRMLLVSETLDALIGPPGDVGTPRGDLQLASSEDINMEEDEEWYDKLLSRIAEYRKLEPAVVASKASSILARSEAIRYIQLGNPECIIIDDGKTRDRVIKRFSNPAQTPEISIR
jgi:hypothetical protein